MVGEKLQDVKLDIAFSLFILDATLMPVALLCFDRQEYIRRQLEEEQRHLEMLQEQLLREQAMLLVSLILTAFKKLPEHYQHLLKSC